MELEVAYALGFNDPMDIPRNKEQWEAWDKKQHDKILDSIKRQEHRELITNIISGLITTVAGYYKGAKYLVDAYSYFKAGKTAIEKYKEYINTGDSNIEAFTKATFGLQTDLGLKRVLSPITKSGIGNIKNGSIKEGLTKLGVVIGTKLIKNNLTYGPDINFKPKGIDFNSVPTLNNFIIGYGYPIELTNRDGILGFKQNGVDYLIPGATKEQLLTAIKCIYVEQSKITNVSLELKKGEKTQKRVFNPPSLGMTNPGRTAMKADEILKSVVIGKLKPCGHKSIIDSLENKKDNNLTRVWFRSKTIDVDIKHSENKIIVNSSNIFVDIDIIEESEINKKTQEFCKEMNNRMNIYFEKYPEIKETEVLMRCIAIASILFVPSLGTYGIETSVVNSILINDNYPNIIPLIENTKVNNEKKINVSLYGGVNFKPFKINTALPWRKGDPFIDLCCYKCQWAIDINNKVLTMPDGKIFCQHCYSSMEVCTKITGYDVIAMKENTELDKKINSYIQNRIKKEDVSTFMNKNIIGEKAIPNYSKFLEEMYSVFNKILLPHFYEISIIGERLIIQIKKPVGKNNLVFNFSKGYKMTNLVINNTNIKEFQEKEKNFLDKFNKVIKDIEEMKISYDDTITPTKLHEIIGVICSMNNFIVYCNVSLTGNIANINFQINY